MSWAATRETTRVEDEAYSLLGIFGVHLSLIYGEGRNAFLRLQEEIIKHIPDQSIFVWGTSSFAAQFFDRLSKDAMETFKLVVSEDGNTVGDSGHGLLASSPRLFLNAGNIIPLTPTCWNALSNGQAP